ncbi:MAG TPA: sugar phosphate isomerase/epimerase [Candidatus Limnocylindria bacterium]|nr:sugar phosphate isomerase/epimerase [Candidatus Limnocylindria bacterium]
MQTISRRDFLKTTAAASIAAVSSVPLFAAEGGPKKPALGVQLYSVRKDCEKDLPGTLHAVSKIGYKAVEFAGYYERDAKTLRKLLDDAGLKCCGTHIGLETMLGDKIAKTVEFNQAIGNINLIVPSLPEKYRKTKEDWQKTADLFSDIAVKVKPQGMRVGFHNHSVEFVPIGGEIPWDIFFARASKDVRIQYDIGNAAPTGADARVYLAKYPGRVVSTHVKPFSKSNPNALIGQDELPWPEIFSLCENVAGVEWNIIEYERENEAPLASIEKLRKIMCDLGKC